MTNRKRGRSADLPKLSDIYDEGYFHGRNSGYPPQGYRLAHPEWNAWLDAIHLLKPAGSLVDVGSAYGYLVRDARTRGYLSFGLDASHFALQQEPDFRPWLVEGQASCLPFKDRSADIVTLFDVLEHLLDPAACLAEVRRILKPDGLLAGATPDPVFFDRPEETHFSERPPSYWLTALGDLGFHVSFRFSNEIYNFQFFATPSSSSLAPQLDALQHDFIAAGVAEIVHVEESTDSAEPGRLPAAQAVLPPAGRRIDALLRSGWGVLGSDGRKLTAFPASVYLFNRGPSPLVVRLEIRLRHTPDFSTLRLRFNSSVIGELNLDSEQTERVIQVEELLVPAGGHHLFFDLFPGGAEITVQSIRLRSDETSRPALTTGLPFDLYQRYQLSAEIVRRLAPEDLLDVGGYLGDENGHLAISHDFLQESGSPRITVTDVRQCDHPDYLRASAGEQPFADRAFDFVLSLDVLEHLAPANRIGLLEELDRLSRRWILIGAPFASPEVEQAEARLADSLMGARRFLQEHRQLGLPALSEVRDFYLTKGYGVLTFPNGYLPSWLYWQVTTQHYFGLNDYHVARQYNSLYGRLFFPSDNREPAYRHLLLVSKSPLPAAVQLELERLVSPEPTASGETSDLGAQPAFLELHERIARLLEKRQKALTDTQFLINERQKLIVLLRRELETPVWRRLLSRLKRKRDVKR